MGLGLLLATSCKGPGPLEEGRSRIKVQCTGFALDGTPIHVQDGNGFKSGQTQDLGCFFRQSIYFDVPVPPNIWDVMTGTTRIERVQFGGPGETKTVKVWNIVVSYSYAT
jgi:hypothetical protein